VGTGRFAEKSVIVTGAGNGIGLRYAESFAAEGASVTIADIDAPAAAAAARRIDGSQAVTVDVADETSVAQMVAVTVERFGGVDVLVNNAGLHMGRYNLTSTLSLEDSRSGVTWAVFDYVQVEPPSGRVSIAGYGHYFETYRKCADGRWRISSKRNQRLRLDHAPWTLGD
jgi:NAD(P)-dependent dehydrogenase (short-subunit alcohol dehydrogenase family)